MAEPKPFASLSSGLLARKGGAMPAMRRQMSGLPGASPHGTHGQDDLGWNDMGEDSVRHSESLSTVGLTPMPQVAVPVAVTPAVEIEAPIPAVVEQRRELAERVAAPVVQEKPKAPAPVKAAPAKKAKVIAPTAEAARIAKAAFTLRLDPERHLRLRLACAVGNRSAQQIVTEALDAFLSNQPQIEALADQLPRPTGAKN